MATTDTAAARKLVVSYPADLSEWGRSKLEHPAFRSYLTKAHETAAAGDRWAEFVGVGCCGDALDVPLVVESVQGGSRLTAETTVEFAVREACGLAGGWQVQSAAGPRD